MTHSDPKSDAVQWIERNLIALHPARGPVPLELYPFQCRVVDSFSGKSRSISDTPLSKYIFDKDDSRQVVFRLSKQPRQMGKTIIAQASALYRAVKDAGTRVLVVGVSKHHTMEMVGCVVRMCDTAVSAIEYTGIPKGSVDTTIALQNGSSITFVARYNVDKLRGTFDFIVIDEIAFYKDNQQDDVLAFVARSIADRGVVSMSTTPYGTEAFAKMWNELYFVDMLSFMEMCTDIRYWDHPNRPYGGQWAVDNLDNLGAQMFMREVLCEFV